MLPISVDSVALTSSRRFLLIEHLFCVVYNCKNVSSKFSSYIVLKTAAVDHTKIILWLRGPGWLNELGS